METRDSRTLSRAMRRAGLFVASRNLRQNLAAKLAGEEDPIRPIDLQKLATDMSHAEAEAKLQDGTWRVWRRLARERAQRWQEDRQRAAIRGTGWTEADEQALARRLADEFLDLVQRGRGIRAAARSVGFPRQHARQVLGAEAAFLGEQVVAMLRRWRAERRAKAARVMRRVPGIADARAPNAGPSTARRRGGS